MTTTRGAGTEYTCSFCGKTQGQVRRLIAGPSRVFICDQCIQLCQQVIDEEATTTSPSATADTAPRTLTPRQLYERLDEYVVGQDQAKKVLSVAVYNHYKRVWRGGVDAEVELQKANILLVGPTGCGKTLLAQTLARVLDVPFSISDSTSLTEAGYVGEDVENILLRLIQAADFDVSRAEQGIIYIDEIDKIGRKAANPSITRDVSGEGVQQGLLKIIEGCVANVPPQGGRKHPHQEFLQLKTDNILFICGGTFEGLEEIVARRLAKGRHSMGFLGQLSGDIPSPEETLLHTQPQDLVEFGFIPEFVGRLSLMVNLAPLDSEALVRILTEPKNAIVKQYQRLFVLDGVDLSFTPEALQVAADEALKGKTGARALRTIIEQVLLDVMYELPSLPDVARCIVDGDMVRGHKRPLLLTSSGAPVTEEQEESA